MNLDGGSTLYIVALGPVSDASYTISFCKDKRCATCKTFQLEKQVTSNTTKRNYKTKNLTGENLNCHSQNVIYLLTCLCCNIQYVGETASPLHIRFNTHRTGKSGCEHIIRHCKEACNGYNFKYNILEKLPGNGHIPSGELDPEMSKIRKLKEDEWMKKLRTIYPYGLNEKASQKETNSSILEPAIGKLFPPLSRAGERTERSRENRLNHSSNVSCHEFFEKLNDSLQQDLKNSFNDI